MRTHIELIQLIVAYTLTGALVFTIAVTCLSLVGWVRFASASQQRKLFSVLIIELSVTAVAFFAGFIRFDAAQVQEQVIRDYMSAPKTSAVGSDLAESNFKGSKFSGGLFDNTLFVSSSFRFASFQGSLFSGSRFEGSSFEHAQFKGANFKDADLRGVDLSESIVDGNTRLPTTTNPALKRGALKRAP